MYRIVSFLIIGFAMQSNAATVTCKFGTGVPPPCTSFVMTPITYAAEPINITGQSMTYMDKSFLNIAFDSTFKTYFIPTNIFRFFPRAVSFSAIGSSLTTIVPNAIINCPSLTSIALYSNLFQNLPASFAEQCSNVTHLYVEKNSNFVSLHVDAFKGLLNLVFLRFNYNKIDCLPPGLFGYSPKIQAIDFQWNEIVALDPNTFINLPSLSYITLWSNKITFVPNLNLTNSGYSGTVSLNFDFNPIIAINPSFITQVFEERTRGTITLSFYNPSTTSTPCVPQNVYQQHLLNFNNWRDLNSSYVTCYNNWTPAMQNDAVSCLPAISTTQSPPASSQCGCGGCPWYMFSNSTILLALNTIRNFTVTFI